MRFEFDVKGFVDYIVFVKNNSNELPQITAEDLEDFFRFQFANKMETPAFPTTEWESNILVTSNGYEEISYKVEYEHNRMEFAADVINGEFAKDNTDPEMQELTGGATFADDDDDDEPIRFYNRLKNTLYLKLLAEEIYSEYTATVVDLLNSEYQQKVIDVEAVDTALANTPKSIISQATGIPGNTIIKYQKPNDDPNHRDWLSENAKKLGRWANAKKGHDKYDAKVQ